MVTKVRIDMLKAPTSASAGEVLEVQEDGSIGAAPLSTPQDVLDSIQDNSAAIQQNKDNIESNDVEIADLDSRLSGIEDQGISKSDIDVSENTVPIGHSGGLVDSPLSLESGVLTSTVPIQAPDGGSILIGDTLDIKTIGQQIGAQDLVSGTEVIFPFRRVDSTGSSGKLSAFGYTEAAWTALQPSTAETLTLQKGEQSVSYYESTSASKVSGWRIQGLSGELRLELFGSFNGSERLIFDSDLHFDVNGNPIILDFKNGGILEFLLNWSIGFRLGQTTKIVLTGKSETPVQLYGVTVPEANTFGEDAQLSNGGFIPWFESLRALEAEDSFYPNDDNSMNTENAWSGQKVDERVRELGEGINMADTDEILESHDKKVLMYDCTSGTVDKQVPVLGIEDNGWSVQITNTGNSQLRVRRENQTRTISNGGSMDLVYCSATDRFIITAYRRSTSELDPISKTFVNETVVTLEEIESFKNPNVYLISENTDIIGLPIKVLTNGQEEEYLSIGAYELKESGEWRAGASRNAFRGSVNGKYVVFDNNVDHWIIGQLNDHNLGGFAGTDKQSLSGTGFIPEAYGAYDVSFDFSQIPDIYLEECEPIVSFDLAGSSLTVSFNGAYKTGLILV